MNTEVTQPQLETRTCTGCGVIKFRVMPGSPVTWCSFQCKADAVEDPKLRAKMLQQGIPLRRGRPKTTYTKEQLAVRAAQKREQYATNPKVREQVKERKRREYARLDTEVKKNETPEELNGVGETESANAPYGMLGITSTERSTMPKNETEENVETLPVASTEQPKDVSAAIFQSENLLKSTSEHLYGLMVGLTHNRPPAELQAYDPNTVNAAVGCASQIQKIMRLRLDAMKLANEINKGSK